MSVPQINCYNYLLFVFQGDSAGASALTANYPLHRIKINLAEFTKQTKQMARKKAASIAILVYLERNTVTVDVIVY